MITLDNNNIHFNPKFETKEVHKLDLELSNIQTNQVGYLVTAQLEKIRETYRLQTVYMIYNDKVKQYFRKPNKVTIKSSEATIFSRKPHAVYFTNRLNLTNSNWQIYEVGVYSFDLK